MIKSSIKIETITTHELIIGRQDIIDYLLREYNIIGEAYTRDINIYFKVPTGADYSGAEIKVDKDNPIHVQIILRNFKNE